MPRGHEGQALRKKIQEYSYALGDRIGKGYSSQVFRGRHDVTQESVAIKVVEVARLKNEVHRSLLASEVDILHEMRGCASSIQLKHVYSTKHNTYIITELCEGGDLAQGLSARKAYPEAEALRIMHHLLRGYVQLCQRGVVHRDLKPANILLKDDRPVIADFGFAMRSGDCKKYASFNVGSPVYMPPEALSDGKYSFKSDIWALGVTMFELLTGRTPWRAKNEKELSRRIADTPVRSLLPSQISLSSANFLLRALTLDSHSRLSPEGLHTFISAFEHSSTSLGVPRQALPNPRQVLPHYSSLTLLERKKRYLRSAQRQFLSPDKAVAF